MSRLREWGREARLGGRGARSVIFTADDFGLSEEVNEAIERAYRHGVLCATSLMVAEPAAADAVERARRMPGLKVGLHLTLIRGRALLPPDEIPDLADSSGRFRDDDLRAGLVYFLRPSARRQLAAEIRAQFEAFKATGLELDHVDAHCHLHMHPTVFGLMLSIGREYGLRAVRLPREPWLPAWRASGRGLAGRFAASVLLRPWSGLIRRRCARRNVACNDHLFGMADVGRMDETLVLRLLELLPRGVTELHFHPSIGPREAAPDAARELAALLSPAVAERLDALSIRRTCYGELARAGRSGIEKSSD